MIRRLYARWRHRRVLARSHGPVVNGLVLRDMTAKQLGLCGNGERHDEIELTPEERDQIADIEHRWNGGQR